MKITSLFLASDVYTLRVSRKGPSKRALAFREQIRAIFENEAF